MSANHDRAAIYLDYCATTPVDERVLEAMLPYFSRSFGNAASQSHPIGRAAKDAVDTARRQLAALLCCDADDVIWTSGATEANNLAIKGLVSQFQPCHVITQATEHKAVLDPLRSLTRLGIEVTILDVASDGHVDPEAVRAAIRTDTRLVSVMWANNEIGTLMPISAIGRICEAAGTVLHCDASQAVGKVPVDVGAAGVDLLSLSGHKLYGPKGIGALICRRSRKLRTLSPLIEGGGHERGLRSGTLNVPGIVGLGEAAALALAELESDSQRLSQYRDAFERAVSRLGDVRINGAGGTRLPNVSNVAFLGVDAESLLIALEDVAASTGSACTAGSLEPSHVLKALGLPESQQRSSVRFSFGRQTTHDEVVAATAAVGRAVTALRGLSAALI